jgi:hypothetical protein
LRRFAIAAILELPQRDAKREAQHGNFVLAKLISQDWFSFLAAACTPSLASVSARVWAALHRCGNEANRYGTFCPAVLLFQAKNLSVRANWPDVLRASCGDRATMTDRTAPPMSAGASHHTWGYPMRHLSLALSGLALVAMAGL